MGRRPMKRLMPAGLPGPSSMNSSLASLIRTGLPSGPAASVVTPEDPTICRELAGWQVGDDQPSLQRLSRDVAHRIGQGVTNEARRQRHFSERPGQHVQDAGYGNRSLTAMEEGPETS